MTFYFNGVNVTFFYLVMLKLIKAVGTVRRIVACSSSMSVDPDSNSGSDGSEPTYPETVGSFCMRLYINLIIQLKKI